MRAMAASPSGTRQPSACLALPRPKLLAPRLRRSYHSRQLTLHSPGVLARRRDGDEFSAELTLTWLDAEATLAIIRDATPRHEPLSAMIASVLADTGTTRDVLGRAAEALVRRFDAAFARIWTLNDHEQ